MAMYDEYFNMDYRPELHNGDIIIFPSFVEHYVLSGGTGSTIAGNVFLTPSPDVWLFKRHVGGATDILDRGSTPLTSIS